MQRRQLPGVPADPDHAGALGPARARTCRSRSIGRQKLSGAPLGCRSEFSALDLDRKDAQGNPVIPADAHVRLAAPQTNGGAVILRRAFSYNNGTTPFTERWPPWRQALEYDAGLLFLGLPEGPAQRLRPDLHPAGAQPTR